LKLNHLSGSFINHILFMCLMVLHRVKMEQYDIFQQHVTLWTQHTMHKKMCCIIKILPCRSNLQTINIVEKAMDDTVTLLWLCKIWNQCVNGVGGGRWDVCYKFSLWAIGTICTKTGLTCSVSTVITMSGVVAKHILHTQWGGIFTEQHMHKTPWKCVNMFLCISLFLWN
jgi:hypothetical protein